MSMLGPVPAYLADQNEMSPYRFNDEVTPNFAFL